MGRRVTLGSTRSLLLRRAPIKGQLGGEVEADMKNIANCIHCNQCKSKCPYGLDTPKLLQDDYKDYFNVLSGKTKIIQ